MQVTGRGTQMAMAEDVLELLDRHARRQLVGGEGMAQSVNTAGPGDAGLAACLAVVLLHAGDTQVMLGISAREQPGRRSEGVPVAAQHLQHGIGQRHLAVFLPFCLNHC